MGDFDDVFQQPAEGSPEDMQPLKPNQRLAGFVQHAAGLHRAGRLAEAERIYLQILHSKPDPAVQLLLGTIRLQQQRYCEALTLFEASLEREPGNPFALYNLGCALLALNRHREAIASFEKTLRIKPDHVKALNNLGLALKELKCYRESLEAFSKALAISPDFFDAHLNRGIVLRELGLPEDALASYDRAVAISPRDARGHASRGSLLHQMRREAEALTSFQRALALDPHHPHAFGGLADCARAVCDWNRTGNIDLNLDRQILQPKAVFPPLALLYYRDDPDLQLRCARKFASAQERRPRADPTRVPLSSREKIRIGYFSGDFRRHVVGSAIVRLLELHDRTKFELIAISFGPDDRSELRARIAAAADDFHDVRMQGDSELAASLRDLRLDIVVDLTGYTWHSRTQVLAHRPAPIQVNYLGYPGTTGTTFIDYILADQIVLPIEQQKFFTEKIVHLPHCFLPNDLRQQSIWRVPARSELGLPANAFVFCAFTKSNKVTPDVFAIWMRILRKTAGSVLWLSEMNPNAADNLRREAEAREVHPERLIFAPRLDSLAEHLARHAQADLYLDTLPYNAHTSAATALWAGVPVLTCAGKSFAARVGASVLHGAGLPELVTYSLDEYEALALRLAHRPDRLTSLRRKLEASRLTYPLFDCERLCRAIEAAYAKMQDLHVHGERPSPFRVDFA